MANDLYVGFKLEMREKGYSLEILGMGQTEKKALGKNKPSKLCKAIFIEDTFQLTWWNITDWLVDDVDLVGWRLSQVTRGTIYALEQLFYEVRRELNG